MSMGFQVCLWSRVPQCPQVPPPHYPQVQILRRRHAHRGVKEGERERMWTPVPQECASCSVFFFLLLGSCIRSIVFVKSPRMSLTDAVLRNATIIFHIRREFSTSGTRRSKSSFRSIESKIQDGILNTNNPLPLQLRLPTFLPTIPSVTHTLRRYLQ